MLTHTFSYIDNIFLEGENIIVIQSYIAQEVMQYKFNKNKTELFPCIYRVLIFNQLSMETIG